MLHVPPAQDQPRLVPHVQTITTSHRVNASLNVPLDSTLQSHRSVLLVTLLVLTAHLTPNVTLANQVTIWMETHAFLNAQSERLPTNKTRLVLLVTPTSSITRPVSVLVPTDTTEPPTRHALPVLLLARPAQVTLFVSHVTPEASLTSTTSV